MDIDEKKDNNYIPKHAPKTNDTTVKEDTVSKKIEVLEEKNNPKTTKKQVTIRKKRRRIKIKWVIVLIVIFSIIIIYSLLHIINWQIDNKKTDNITKKIEEIATTMEIEDTPETELVNEEEDEDNPYWYYITFPLIDVDIRKLKEQNSDTIGWINVNNTNINYPFVKTSDNDYYLTHSFDKSENEAGWLFLDYRNNKDFSNRNNIIYGHSRLNKTMFGSLSRVLKYDWQANKDNHVIRISLENENTLWQIFSVYKIKTESYYITTDFNSDNEYLDFLNTIKSRSLYDFNVNLTSSDKILTLSTCYSDTERTVVHARLIKRAPK